MTPNFDHESNQVEDEYYGEEQNDLDDFIVYSDDDEDKPVKKQKQHQLQDKTNLEEEEDFEEEEEEVALIGAREILSLREKLKEEIRRKNAAMAAGVDKYSSSARSRPRCRRPRTGSCGGRRGADGGGVSRQHSAPLQIGFQGFVGEVVAAHELKSS